MRRVPFTTDGKTCLYVARDRHRDVVVWKLADLDDARLRRPKPHETTAQLLDAYADTRVRADTAIHELDLEDTGTAWFGETDTLRWVLVHMVQETARHAGHADVLRELLDGTAGDHP